LFAGRRGVRVEDDKMLPASPPRIRHHSDRLAVLGHPVPLLGGQTNPVPDRVVEESEPCLLAMVRRGPEFRHRSPVLASRQRRHLVRTLRAGGKGHRAAVYVRGSHDVV
jgi:hypothetical protein